LDNKSKFVLFGSALVRMA